GRIRELIPPPAIPACVRDCRTGHAALTICDDAILIMPRLFILAVVLVLLNGCEKSSPTSQTETTLGRPRTSMASGMEITTKSGLKMVLLPGGEFIMGSDRGNPDEAPAHKVKVTAFLMDKFEVTHEMFTKAQLPDPSHWQDNPQKPV